MNDYGDMLYRRRSSYDLVSPRDEQVVWIGDDVLTDEGLFIRKFIYASSVDGPVYLAVTGWL